LQDKVNLDNGEVSFVVSTICGDDAALILKNLEAARKTSLTFYRTLETVVLGFFVDRHASYLKNAHTMFKMFDLDSQGKISAVV